MTLKAIPSRELNRSAALVARSDLDPFLYEELEDRTLLTIFYTPQNGAETVHDYGGPKLGNVSPGTPIYLIFWGSYWNTTAGQAQRANDENAINPVLYNSAFLDGLQEYGTTYRAFQPNGTWAVTDTSSDPSENFTDAQVQNEVHIGINNLGLPDSNVYTNTGIYFVITPPNIDYADHGDGGYHGPIVTSGHTNTYYGWLGNYGSGVQGQLDWFTYALSHETSESFTDAAVNVNDGVIVTSSNAEVCDGEAQNYTALLNGYRVQSHWSAANQQYEISDGNSQYVTVNNGALSIVGDQLGTNYNDVVTVDLNSRGGVQVSLNGQYYSFMPGFITSIAVNTKGGSNTTYVYNTSASAPVAISDGGDYSSDIIGNGYNGVQGINGGVSVSTPPTIPQSPLTTGPIVPTTAMQP